MAPRNARLGPNELLHRLLGLDPRAPGLAPAGRAGNRQLQTQLLGLGRCVPKYLVPPGRHEGEPLWDDLRGVAGGVEVLDSTDTDTVHPLQILLHSFARDVAVHPMPPDTGGRRSRRLLEALLQRVDVSGNAAVAKPGYT